MGSKRLEISSSVAPITLTGEGRQDIEVPAGESRFFIEQAGTEEQQFVFHLRYSDSIVFIAGLVQANHEQTPILKTEVIHHVPRTKAETLIKTLARDAAQPHYEGLIRIADGAQESESYLNHHSLLLGEQAKSWTLPSLEIKANQVKCSHAATLKTITDLDLFYLRSRGLEPDQARHILIEAFLADLQS